MNGTPNHEAIKLDPKQVLQLQDALVRLQGVDYARLQEDIGLIQVESPQTDVVICSSRCAG